MNDEPKTDHDRLVSIHTMMCKVVVPTLKTQNGRIASLEKWRYLLSGAIGTIILVLTGKLIWF